MIIAVAKLSSWRGYSCYIFDLVISEKVLRSIKILLEIWEKFLHESNFDRNSYKFSHKIVLISLFYFAKKQKQEPVFQQPGDLVKRNIFFFDNRKLRSTSKACRIQQNFAKELSYLFGHFESALLKVLYSMCFNNDSNIGLILEKLTVCKIIHRLNCRRLTLLSGSHLQKAKLLPFQVPS